MKYKILIVEDEVSLSNIILDTLTNEGFKVYQAFNGDEGIDLFYEFNPDLILLDINLPKKNGWSVCKEIRKDSNIPILFMTARDSEIDEIRGLELGADDYITKPFNLKILTIRIKKLLKIDRHHIYTLEDINFDFERNYFSIGTEKIDFSKKETELLQYFIKNKKRVLTRDIILNEIWGYEVDVEDRVVDTLVKRVRKKLVNYSDIIKTVRGVGYIFDDEIN
ncbi:MAG: response regulator transcription factor [Fusobacteriaceae bacterium]